MAININFMGKQKEGNGVQYPFKLHLTNNPERYNKHMFNDPIKPYTWYKSDKSDSVCFRHHTIRWLLFCFTPNITINYCIQSEALKVIYTWGERVLLNDRKKKFDAGQSRENKRTRKLKDIPKNQHLEVSWNQHQARRASAPKVSGISTQQFGKSPIWISLINRLLK